MTLKTVPQPHPENIDRGLFCTARNQVELVSEVRDPTSLSAHEVAGPTVTTLLSPGTELACLDREFTTRWAMGYAAVFRIAECGSEVTGLHPGQLVFAMGNHRSWQRLHQSQVIPLPAGLEPQVAVFARLMSVSWSTLVTTTARPPDPVLVTGLGPVGNLAAQILRASGYTVSAVDPDAGRRALAKSHGIQVSDALPSAPAQGDGGGYSLVVECSGHERAVLDACRAVRKRGEVVLVGVPWMARAPDLTAHALLHEVFHRYIVLRSGWEWEVPYEARDFTIGSLRANLAAGMLWLAEGRVNTTGLGSVHAAETAPRVYADLIARKAAAPTAIFRWLKD